MGPIRIDENSTSSNFKEVFGLQEGEVFGVSPDFFSEFVRCIPKDRFFKFVAIEKGSTDFIKYGSNCYRVICNAELITF